MPKLGVLALIVSIWLLAVTLSTGISELPEFPATQAVVVIDAGHGGKDPGAIVDGVQEKDINLAIALRMAVLAQDHPRLRIVLTRSSDRYVDLRERVLLADQVGAALYLSIHANYNSDPKICGVETLVDDSRAPTDLSFALAEVVQAAVCAETGAQDRGVYAQRLYMRHTELPAVLVEVGYLSCPSEQKKLLDPVYQERIARGILRGILAFLGLD